MGSKSITKIKLSFGDGKTFKDSKDYYYEGVTNLKEISEYLVEKLLMNGTSYAKQVCPKDTGELQNSIYYKSRPLANGAKGEIVTDCDHAAYVEFGTGIVGASFQYMGDMGDYVRNVPTRHKDETGGWHCGKNYLIYTHGYAPNPFMYQTAKYMEGIVPQVAKGILKNGK